MRRLKSSLEIFPTNNTIYTNIIKDTFEVIDYHEFSDRVLNLSSNLGNSYGTSTIVSFLTASIDMFVIAHTAYKTIRPFVLVGPDVPKNYVNLILESIEPDIIAVPYDWKDNISSLDESYTILKSTNLNNSLLYRKKIKNNDLFFKTTNIKKEDTAYIVLTSGSTGSQKPVAVSRTNLKIYSNWYISTFDISINDRIIIACSPGFDMMINALFPPLTVGASIIIPDRNVLLNPISFVQNIKENHITFINMTPAFSELLLDNIHDNKTFPDIRVLEFGGDQLYKKTARKWRKHAPNAEQYNCYGVAEATVTSFWHQLRKEDFEGDGIVPIGKPLEGMSFNIIPVNDETTTSGVLQIQGPLLSMGYINQSNNDKNFIKNRKGRTIAYNTGDLVNIRKDGLLEFFGRSDKQIKISGGYRIDLLEIENLILNTHDEISKVFVLHQNKLKATILWAFCVSENNNLENNIKETIIYNLPAYVRLAGIFFLESLPLNKNGKVDISQLEKHIKSTGGHNFSQNNSLTDILSSLWIKSLGFRVENIKEKDYFKIGGTSFSFANLVGLIELKFEISIDITTMLLKTSFKDQLEYISEILGSGVNIKQTSILNSNLAASNFKQKASYKNKNNAVSVIGAGVITPQCNDLNEYLNFLSNGTSAKHTGNPNRFNIKKDNIIGLIKYCFGELPINEWSKGSLLKKEEIEEYDYQYILWYAAAKQAIENSNISYSGKRVGVFAGLGPTFFDGNPKNDTNKWTLAGTTPSFATGILSYEYDFKGPNMIIDTACSSSLVAIHLACQSLLTGEIDIAIAGGAQLFYSKKSFELLDKAGIVSPTRKCIPFSKEADGYIPGEGAGAVILTTDTNLNGLTENCLGYIVKTVVNHDGKTATATLPNLMQQKELYKNLIFDTDIDPERISFIEAHGTGTILGDPIEVTGIREFFSTKNRKKPLYIGSAKGYLGHLHYASGVIGFIKALLQLNEKKVFKQPNISELNPRILSSNDKKIQFPIESINLNNCEFAIVNSFGFSGTNCATLVSGSTSPLNEAKDEMFMNTERDNMLKNNDMKNIVHLNSNNTLHSTEDIKNILIELISSHLNISSEKVSIEKNAVELGVDSISAMDISDSLKNELKVELSPTLLLEHSSLDDVIAEVVKILHSHTKSIKEDDDENKTNHAINTANYYDEINLHNNNFETNKKSLEYHSGQEKLSNRSIAIKLSEQFRSENEVLNKLIENGLQNEMISIINELWNDQHEILKLLLLDNKKDITLKQKYGRNNIETHKISDEMNNDQQDVKQVEDIVSEILNLPIDMISENDDFEKDLGLTSLKRVDLCTRIITACKGNMDMFDELLACRSIKQVKKIII
jgi:3-oxoacyl-(acyl-carrier-protein) synthase/acyl-coenzyme A synthetase/AMP-(fatty) acid ligase/acyl carrier protein